MKPRKLITEREILARLTPEEWGLPPLTVQSVQTDKASKDKRLDAIVTFSWQKKSYRFGAKVRKLWTPKAVSEAADEAQRNACSKRLSPLVIIPYLNEERLQELEAREISGIDLCGNGVVVVPGQLLIFRSGAPNRYRWETQIKNVYRGVSAIVARVFLLVSDFPSVGNVLEQIRALGGDVTLPTVSKVCKSLEQDLVIERTRGKKTPARRLRLLQPDKLLNFLRDNYVPPDITRTFTGKFSGPPQALVARLIAWKKKSGKQIVQTGAGSVDAYAVMAREPVQVFYCSDIAALKKSLGGELTETERFANVKVFETQEESVYFDQRPELVASPLQTYFELAKGDKREMETAEQVRAYILNQISAKKNKR